MSTSNDDILTAVGRIEGRIEGIETRLGEHNRATIAGLSSINERANNHAERLTKLERKQSWFMGGLAAIPVVGAAAVAAVKYLQNH